MLQCASMILVQHTMLSPMLTDTLNFGKCKNDPIRYNFDGSSFNLSQNQVADRISNCASPC